MTNSYCPPLVEVKPTLLLLFILSTVSVPAPPAMERASVEERMRGVESEEEVEVTVTETGCCEETSVASTPISSCAERVCMMACWSAGVKGEGSARVRESRTEEHVVSSEVADTYCSLCTHCPASEVESAAHAAQRRELALQQEGMTE